MQITRDELRAIDRWIKHYESSKGRRWKICVPDGLGGQIREQGFESKQVAVLKASDFFRRKLQNNGVISVSTAQTFEDYSIQWLRQKVANGLRPQSLQRYEAVLRLRILPEIGHLKLADIKKPIVRELASRLESLGANQTHYVMSILIQIIRSAETNDLIPYTGVRDLVFPKPQRKQPKFLTPKQISGALDQLIDEPENHIFAFALLTGLRAGEIAALKWDAIRVDERLGDYAGYIHVFRMVEQKSGQLLETSKNGDYRKVPIFPELRRFLPSPGKADEFVFGGEKPVDVSHMARKAKRLFGRMGLPTVTFHQLRHSACSLWQSRGIDRVVVSKMMGHRDLDTTNRYSHANDEMVGTAILRIIQGEKRDSNNSTDSNCANY